MKGRKVGVTGTHYTIGGHVYARVTDVIASTGRRYEVEQWKKRVGEERARSVMEEAGKWGTDVHALLAHDDLGNRRTVDRMTDEQEDLIIPLLTYREWKKEYIVRWIWVEQLAFSDKLGVAGTVDRVGYFRGDKEAAICDIKTGAVHEAIGMQLAAYRLLYRASKTPQEPPVKRMVVISLPRNNPGSISVREYTSKIKDGERGFLAALKLYKAMNK